MKVRIIKPEGNNYSCKFVRAKIVRKDGIWQYKIGWFKPQYYPYKSRLHSTIMDGKVCDVKLSNGLNIDCPSDVLRWNYLMSAQALEEHSPPSKWKTLKPLIFLGISAILFIILVLAAGSRFDQVVNASLVTVSKMDGLFTGGV